MIQAILRHLRGWLPLAALWLLVCAPANAQNLAVTCSTTGISDLAFGTVDPQSSLTNTSSTISFSCSNPNNQIYSGVVCFSITDGVTGSRQMLDGSGDMLPFQVYTNSTYSTIWGAGTNSLIVSVSIPNNTTAWANTATLYGQVPANQTSTVPGSYQYSFAGTVTTMAVNVAKNFTPTSCTGVTAVATGRAFHATALVANKCTVSATTLDFGAPSGLLTANADSTSTITTQCASGTPYQIGRGNGLHASGTTRQMAGGSSEFIAYELYRDSSRAQRWGSTLNTDTVSLIGNGAPQSTTVYGRVAPQSTPSPSTYSDTITVTVTY